MMLNYVMIHVKNNLPTSFFGDLQPFWAFVMQMTNETDPMHSGEGIKRVNGSSSKSIIALSFKS
jgi:hypothetical protein